MGNRKHKNKSNNILITLVIIWLTWIIFFIFVLKEINNIDKQRYNSSSSFEEISTGVSQIIDDAIDIGIGIGIGNMDDVNDIASIDNIDNIDNNISDVSNVSKKAEETIVKFYDNINKSNFNWFYSLLDKTIRSNYDIRTYFSKVRIERFLKRITWKIEIVQIDELSKYSKESDYSVRKGFNYTLDYNINWISYKEVWEVVLMSYDWGNKFYINSLFCITKNCWKLPFYN